MEQILALFSNHTFCVVALGASLLGITTGALGSFAVLRKESLLGDGITHCALPGVILAFCLTGKKEIVFLLLGGLLTGLLGCFTITFLTKHSRIKFDSALAMVLAVYFGCGMVLLTYAQKIPNANQAGLDGFIYGQAAAMLKSDVQRIALFSLGVFVLLFLCWKQIKLLCFDPILTHSLGYPVEKLDLLLHFLIILAMLVGLQTVGVILMSAMLVSPAVAARHWVNQLGPMVVLSGLFGGIAAFLGTMASSLAPSLPTGATIVVVSSGMALFSLLFGQKHGLIPQLIRKKTNGTMSTHK